MEKGSRGDQEFRVGSDTPGLLPGNSLSELLHTFGSWIENGPHSNLLDDIASGRIVSQAMTPEDAQAAIKHRDLRRNNI